MDGLWNGVEHWVTYPIVAVEINKCDITAMYCDVTVAIMLSPANGSNLVHC